MFTCCVHVLRSRAAACAWRKTCLVVKTDNSCLTCASLVLRLLLLLLLLGVLWGISNVISTPNVLAMVTRALVISPPPSFPLLFRTKALQTDLAAAVTASGAHNEEKRSAAAGEEQWTQVLPRIQLDVGGLLAQEKSLNLELDRILGHF